MNKANTKRLFIVLLVLVTILSACCFIISCDKEIPEVINSYEYTIDSFTYTEKHNSINSYYVVNTTVTDYASYYFDEEITTEKCNRFVTFAEQLFEHLGYEELPDKWLKFFITDDIKTPRAETEEYTVYFSTSNTKTVEFINYVLQALNTNTLNYGLLYGVSSQIFTELKWGKQDIIKESSIKSYLEKEKNRFILDLTYPVFQNKFSSKEQIKYAKSISIKLVAYIEKTHGKQAFEELYAADLTFDMTFDNLFYGYLNEWLGELKVDKLQVGSELLKCIPYTTDFPYMLITNSCNYYMNKDWVDSGMADHYTHRDFKFDYPSVKNILLKAETSYALVREFFDYTQNARSLVILQYMEYVGGRTYADYITISSISTLTHEYAHLISFKEGIRSSWMKEGISYYCDMVFADLFSNEFYAAYSDKEAFLKFVSKFGDFGEVSTYVLGNYMEKSNNENYYIRFLEGYFYVLFFERSINLHEVFTSYLDSSRFAASIADFLVKTYGKEKYVLLYKKFGDLSDVYDKPQAELIDEYLQYIYNIFN